MKKEKTTRSTSSGQVKKVVIKTAPVKKVAVKTMKTKEKVKRVLTGIVVSDKMQKTVVVSIQRKVAHPLYGKLIKITKKYKVDTNGMDIKIGDIVRMEETRPISRGKHFKVISKGEVK